MFNGVIFILLGALCGAISSFMMRKTLDHRGTVNGYLSFYFLISFLFAGLLSSIVTKNFSWSPLMTLLGGATGLLVITLLMTLGLALTRGPSGLSFAFLNAGAIGAPLLLGLIFGKDFGFNLTLTKLIGLSLVLLGLFWAVWKSGERKFSKGWPLLATSTFLCQAIILSILQWRVLLTNESSPSHRCVPFYCSKGEDIWFMPSMFFFAWLLQSAYFFVKEKRIYRRPELIGGGLGGVANGMSTWFLLEASSLVTGTEKTMIFPLFAVTVIFLCNVFGKILYQEPIHWWATSCCAFGIIVGALF